MRKDEHTGGGLGRLRAALGRSLFHYDPIDHWIGQLDPLRLRRERRARVAEVRDVARDTKSFVLETAPGRWDGHRPGQFVPVTLEIDGRRHTRCYSISSSPARDRLTITVRRKPGGVVSGHLHERVQPGELLVLGEPAGELTLPERPEKLLLVAGGSGATPMRSILASLAKSRAEFDVALLYFERSEAHRILGRDFIASLEASCPNVRAHVLTGPAKPRLDLALLAETVPDFASRRALACGPEPLLDAMTSIYARAGRPGRLQLERFTLPSAPARAEGEAARVTLRRSGVTAELDGHGSLLEQLERAGFSPKHGCRMGICHTCRCEKTSGAIVHLQTGEVQDAPNESVQLCVTAPRGDLVLDL